MDPEEEGSGQNWPWGGLNSQLILGLFSPGCMGAPRGSHPPSLLFFQGMQGGGQQQAIQVGFTPQLASHLG